MGSVPSAINTDCFAATELVTGATLFGIALNMPASAKARSNTSAILVAFMGRASELPIHDRRSICLVRFGVRPSACGYLKYF